MALLLYPLKGEIGLVSRSQNYTMVKKSASDICGHDDRLPQVIAIGMQDFLFHSTNVHLATPLQNSVLCSNSLL
jgi:hypothetical protein